MADRWKYPLGEDFPPGLAWFMVVSMLLFFASVAVIFATLDDTICRAVVCR